jgi:acetolactate synthase-1/2/3 large subunit
MGIGLPAAIGIAYHYQQAKKPHRVLALLGDGGFIMNLQEMETATRLKLNLVVIVWINEALGLVEWGDQTCVICNTYIR